MARKLYDNELLLLTDNGFQIFNCWDSDTKDYADHLLTIVDTKNTNDINKVINFAKKAKDNRIDATQVLYFKNQDEMFSKEECVDHIIQRLYACDDHLDLDFAKETLMSDLYKVEQLGINHTVMMYIH